VHEPAFVCAAGLRAEPAADAGGRRSEIAQVGPSPAHDFPVQRSEFVLAQLLGVHDVARLLSGLQQPSVLDLAVELSEGALRRPPEVRVRRAPGKSGAVAGPGAAARRGRSRCGCGTRPRSRPARPRTPRPFARPEHRATPSPGARRRRARPGEPVGRRPCGHRPLRRRWGANQDPSAWRPGPHPPRRPPARTAPSGRCRRPSEPRTSRPAHRPPRCRPDAGARCGRAAGRRAARRCAGRTSRGPAPAAGPTWEGRAPRPPTRDWPRLQARAQPEQPEGAARVPRHGRPVSRPCRHRGGRG